MERIKWEEYFMAQSHLLALRSTCKRLSVGATIVKDNRIIAGGYNGSVAGEVHCIDEGCLIEDGHCIRTTMCKTGCINRRSNDLRYSFPLFKLYEINNTSRYQNDLLCTRLS